MVPGHVAGLRDGARSMHHNGDWKQASPCCISHSRVCPSRRGLQPCAAKEKSISAPWAMTFDLRERDTLWTDENKARLVKLVASNQLKLSQEELELRLHELVSLVPDLGSKVHMLKPDLLAALLQDLDKAAHQMIRLKETFPDSNISLMVSKRPIMLLQDCDTIVIDARKVCALLRVENLDSLVDKHPGLLDIEAVEEVLDELRRMMPSGTDVRKMLANDPTLLLSAGRGTKRLGDHPD